MTTSKRLSLFLLLLLSFAVGHAGDIVIDFTIDSEDTTPDSVWVNNTTKDSAIMLPYNTSLYLLPTEASLNPSLTESANLKLYPNPASAQATLAYTTNYSGIHHVVVTDMAGRTLSSFSTNLTIGTHQFALPTLLAGNYCVQVSNNEHSTATLLMSSYQGHSTHNITHLSTSELQNTNTLALKSAATYASLTYDAGDTLQLIAYLNNVSDTVTITPQYTQTIDFDISLPPTADELLLLAIDSLYTIAEQDITQETESIDSAEAILNTLLDNIANDSSIVESDYVIAEAILMDFSTAKATAIQQEITAKLDDFESPSESTKAQTIIEQINTLMLAAENRKSTCDTKLQTIIESVVLTLEEWAESGFSANRTIFIDNDTDSLVITDIEYDDFLTGLRTLTAIGEDEYYKEIQGRIRVVFKNIAFENADLEELVNTGQDLEIVGNTGYTLSGVVKNSILENLYHLTDNGKDARANPNLNTKNSNFNNLTIDFTDENEKFTDLNYRSTNIYGNIFGKVNAKGFNWNGYFSCDDYILDKDWEESQRSLFSMNEVFNVVGDYGVDWDIESMEMIGRDIQEHADALRKLEANTSITNADILAAIADGSISVASCAYDCRIPDGLDADGNFLPYMKEAIDMAGDKIEGIGVASDNIGDDHPKAGLLVKVSTDVVQFLNDLDYGSTNYFRQVILTGDDLILKPDTYIDMKYSVIDANIDAGDESSFISLTGSFATHNVDYIKDASTSSSINLLEGADFDFLGSTYFKIIATYENDSRLSGGLAKDDIIDETIEMEIPTTMVGIQNFIDNYKNDTSYELFQ